MKILQKAAEHFLLFASVFQKDFAVAAFFHQSEMLV